MSKNMYIVNFNSEKGLIQKSPKILKVYMITHKRSGLLISKFSLRKFFRYLINYVGSDSRKSCFKRNHDIVETLSSLLALCQVRGMGKIHSRNLGSIFGYLSFCYFVITAVIFISSEYYDFIIIYFYCVGTFFLFST